MWHDLTREAREAGELRVVGITQEQHAERCQLFAQWQGFEWPILWDPFNLTGAKVVPRLFLIDEYGIVRSTRPNPETWEAEFLRRTFEPPDGLPHAARPDVRALLGDADEATVEGRAHRGTSSALWGGETSLDKSVGALAAWTSAAPDEAVAWFRLGVAHRLRFDSSRARPDDFQRAIAAWERALQLDPNQYIWRRRIQQYGPRLDKPYPFYDWVDAARSDVRARGQTPVPLRARLSGAETAAPARALEAGAQVSAPDPQGRIQRDGGNLIGVEAAVAFHTGDDAHVARVHVVLRPRAESEAHWNNEVEPVRVWIDVPDGWRAERQLFEVGAASEGAVTNEARSVDFEIELPAGVRAGQLSGYALFHGCQGSDGACVYRRRDFRVDVAVPQ